MKGTAGKLGVIVAFLVLNGCPLSSAPKLLSAVPEIACSDFMDMSVAPAPEVRMLMLYTEAARNRYTTVEDLIADIEHGVLEVNAVLALSGVPLRAVLAHTELLAGVNDAALGVTVLRDKLIEGAGVYAPAHTLRDLWHADAVGVIATVVEGAAIPMVIPGIAYRDSAYLALGYQELAAQIGLTHELGHILGGVHAPSLPAPHLPRYRYAFPKFCTGCSWDHTVMGATGTPIPYFSNPDVIYYDPAIANDPGIPTGTPSNEVSPADNRRTLANTAAFVASYRITPAWFASSGGSTPWFEKRAADDLMNQVRFADLDGDGDNEADGFRIASGGWEISRSAVEPWRSFRLNDPLNAPLAKLRFADFNGDGADDVFFVDAGTGKWLVWWGNSLPNAAWQDLNSGPAIAGIGVEELAFADLNGDGKVDVFHSDAISGTWRYVSAGVAASWTLLGTAENWKKYLTKNLRFGRFDGDAIADVFRADVTGTAWYWSKSATADWELLLDHDDADVPVEELLFGDFDGDTFTDVLKPYGNTWGISWRARSNPDLLRLSCFMAKDVQLGDFDGDGTTDVIRAGARP